MKTFLRVEAGEENLLESMGAQRDKETHRWYVQDVEDLEKFLPWIPTHLKVPCKPVICQ
jgi:hypothetical protein